MDVSAITTVISTVGFPIVCCIYMAKVLDNFSKLANEVSVTLKGIDDHLEQIDNRLDKIEKKKIKEVVVC